MNYEIRDRATTWTSLVALMRQGEKFTYTYTAVYRNAIRDHRCGQWFWRRVCSATKWPAWPRGEIQSCATKVKFDDGICWCGLRNVVCIGIGGTWNKRNNGHCRDPNWTSNNGHHWQTPLQQRSVLNFGHRYWTADSPSAAILPTPRYENQGQLQSTGSYRNTQLILQPKILVSKLNNLLISNINKCIISQTTLKQEWMFLILLSLLFRINYLCTTMFHRWFEYRLMKDYLFQVRHSTNLLLLPLYERQMYRLLSTVMPNVGGFCIWCGTCYNLIALETLGKYLVATSYDGETVRDIGEMSRAFIDVFEAALFSFKGARLSQPHGCSGPVLQVWKENDLGSPRKQTCSYKTVQTVRLPCFSALLFVLVDKSSHVFIFLYIFSIWSVKSNHNARHILLSVFLTFYLGHNSNCWINLSNLGCNHENWWLLNVWYLNH